MKKALTLLSLISALSYASNFNGSFRAKVDLDKSGELKYTPIDFRLNSKDNKYSFNFEVKGQRENWTTPNEKLRYEKKKLGDMSGYTGLNDDDADSFTSAIKYLVLDDEVNIEKQYILRPFQLFDVVTADKSDHNDHSHDDEHHHGHSHDHDHDHSHDHDGHSHSETKKNQDLFKVENYRNHYKIKDNDDFSIKFDFKYRPDKFTTYGIKYYPLAYYEYNSRLPRNTVDLSLNKSFLLNNNNAILLNTNYVSHSFVKLLLFKLNTEYRTKLSDNDFINLQYENMTQLNTFKERLNTLNSVSFVYDHNKEKRRFHEFYEYIDHEHDKLEQVKLGIKYTNHINHLKNITKSVPLKYDLKETENKVDVDLTLSKKDFLIKGLNFKNESNFNYLNVKRQYATTNQTDVGNGVQVEEMLGKYELYENKKYKINEKDLEKYKPGVFANEDKSEGIRYYIYEEDGQLYLNERKYHIYSKYDKLGKVRKIKNDYNFNNKFNLDYKGFAFMDKFDYTKYNPENVRKIENDLKVSYEQKLGNYFAVKPIIEYNTKYMKKIGRVNEVITYYQNEFKPSVDLAYIYNQDGLKLRVGVVGAYVKIHQKYRVDGIYSSNVEVNSGQQRKLLVGDEYKPGIENDLNKATDKPTVRHSHGHHHHHHSHVGYDITANDEELGVETDIKKTILNEHNNDFNEVFGHEHDALLVNQTFNNAFVISPYVKMDYRLTNDFTINFEANYEKKFNNILKYTHFEKAGKNVLKKKTNNEKFGVKIGLKYTF